MEIILADVLGFCGGVRRAVDMAFETADELDKSYSYGELVHNADVVKALADRDVIVIEDDEFPEGEHIITRSHGITKQVKEAMLAKDNTIIDTTCPFVIRVQNIVSEVEDPDHAVIILGQPNHPEVLAIQSYGHEHTMVVSSIEELKSLNLEPFHSITLVSQTTNPQKFLKNAKEHLKEVFTGELFVYNTICIATKERQEACAELAKKVDCVLVIGGKNSSNTKKLAEIASLYCDNVKHIQTIDDIELDLLKKFNKIGITAGASTPDWVIKEAVSRMENFNNEEMNNEMMEAIDSSFTKVRRGEIVEGEVLYVTDDEVMVNINYRADGIISRDELSNDPNVKPSDLFKQGDEIQVYVMRMDDGDGNVVLSYKRVENMKVWDEMEEKFNNNEHVIAHVTNVVKGGLTCEVEGLNGFIPASHVSIRFQRDLNKYIGQDLECVIIDFDKSRRKFVLSRKNVEEVEVEEKRKEIFENIEEGQLIKGTVQRLTNFGAFVDVGGVDGLIHISELSWNRVKHPSDVVSPGQEVEVQVLNVDEERNRIALGLKQTTEKPWDVFTRTVKVGDVVKGKVVNILDFGAFVRLESGVDGLLHVSQISHDHVEKPEDVLEIGQEIDVKVTDINTDEKKISLSIRALTEAPEQKEQENAPAKPKKTEKPRRQEKPQVKEEPEKTEEFSMAIGDLINLDLGQSSDEEEVEEVTEVVEEENSDEE